MSSVLRHFCQMSVCRGRTQSGKACSCALYRHNFLPAPGNALIEAGGLCVRCKHHVAKHSTLAAFRCCSFFIRELQWLNLGPVSMISHNSSRKKRATPASAAFVTRCTDCCGGSLTAPRARFVLSDVFLRLTVRLQAVASIASCEGPVQSTATSRAGVPTANERAGTQAEEKDNANESSVEAAHSTRTLKNRKPQRADSDRWVLVRAPTKDVQ